MTSNKLMMSLDDIIRLNRQRQTNAPNISTSRQRFTRRGGRNQMFWTYRNRTPYLRNNLRRNRGYRYQGRSRFTGQQFARNKVRLATRLLNRRQSLRYANQGFVQDGYRIRPTPRMSRGLWQRQWRGGRGNQSLTPSFRSDQLLRLRKQQLIQKKINQARVWKAGQLNRDANLMTGKLTVCIPNDLLAKRGRRRRANSFSDLGAISNYRGGFFQRRGSNPYLTSQSMLNMVGSSSNVDVSPEGSIVTTISRQSRASSVGRNQWSRLRSRGARQNRTQTVVENVPMSRVRSGLNLQLQKEIAAIQGKAFQSSNLSHTGSGLSGFRPVPSLTTTTLNERFRSAI